MHAGEFQRGIYVRDPVEGTVYRVEGIFSPLIWILETRDGNRETLYCEDLVEISEEEAARAWGSASAEPDLPAIGGTEPVEGTEEEEPSGDA